MDWLRKHMKTHIAHPDGQITDADLIESRENILIFPGGTVPASRYDASATLHIMSQVADVIMGLQDNAAETETRAKYLAESAIEKLKLAGARIHSAEAARRLAEETLSKAIARLQKAEQELTQAESRIANADTQLAIANEHARAAEIRATNAEKTVNQIEHDIRTQLVGLQRKLTSKLANAA